MPRVTPVVKTTPVGTQGKARQRGQGPARGFWPTAVLLALALVALTLFVTREAHGQESAPLDLTDLVAVNEAVIQGDISDSGETEIPSGGLQLRAFLSRMGLNPGVGFNLLFGTRATYDCGSSPREVRTINPEVRPWGVAGSGSEDFDKFALRYWEGRRNTTCWPAGFAAELFPVNRISLQNWWDQGCYPLPLQRAGRDGTPTTEESYDLAVTTGSRRHEVYRLCWWEQQQGGARGNPIPRTMEWVTNGPLSCTRDREDPELWACESVWGWLLWGRVEGAPPPPPPPLTPGCEPYAESRCEAQCNSLIARWPGVWDKGRCLAAEPPDTIGKLCAGVCPEDPEPPPPPPPPVPNPPPVETCIRCSWDTGQRLFRFRPGVPSTGRVEIVLVCEGVECPEEGP